LTGQVDAGAIFREINEVFKRYGVGKGVGFVPDRLEVSLDRDVSGLCTLVYREFFTYLPADVMEVAMGNAVEFLSSLGVPRDRINRLDGGVEVRLQGDARVVYFPILEMLIQDRDISANVDSACDSLKGSVHSLLELFDFTWAWDEESSRRWRSSVEKLNEIIEANPGMQREIEDLVKRHTGGLAKPEGG